MYPVPTIPTRTSAVGVEDAALGVGHATDEAEYSVPVVMSVLAVIKMSLWAPLLPGWRAWVASTEHVSRGALETFLP